MKILFIHPNFPAQFRFIASELAKYKENEVIFITNTENDWDIYNVRKVFYKKERETTRGIHHYVQPLEDAVITGQGVYRAADKLRKEGFVPDIIIAHSGWGVSLFCRDVFPAAKLLCYFEWFYNASGSDLDFDPNEKIHPDIPPRTRIRNASILIDLVNCDYGLCPTQWQKVQFPVEFQQKLAVIHEGINTALFRPEEDKEDLELPGLKISSEAEIVTYVSRGMEPYRGFPQFIEAIFQLQKKRPGTEVVIVGSDRICYGRKLPDGKNFRQLMLEKFPIDMSHVHFTGQLSYDNYLKVIKNSTVHVYLTVPFVLSWSLLEAMSTGCLVVASNTAPVKEVIKDGYNGYLVDFFSPDKLCDKIIYCLEHPEECEPVRKKARETIVENYSHFKKAFLLARYKELIENILAGNLPVKG